MMANRYASHGRDMEVFVHIDKYEDKDNFLKSYHLLFKKKENKTGNYNWCGCF